MRAPIGTKEALIVTSVAAAGFFLASPSTIAAAEPKELTPETFYENFFNSDHILQYGHTGNNVRILQLELLKLNFYFDQIDGYYGPNTQEAVRKLQTKYRLKPDGIAGTETIEKLNELLVKPKPDTLSLGDEGVEVEQLQTRLKRLDYYHGRVDGRFGRLTEDSIKYYQTKHKLEVTGIASEETVLHLMKNKNVKGIRINTITSTASQTITAPISVASQTHEKTVKKELKVHNDQKNSVDTSIIAIAKKHIGTPYVWGGTQPGGFDCSGFLTYVFTQKGVNIPRTVNEIWNYGTSVEKLSVGDLVFFQTYKKGPSHAGIYLGDGKFVHADSTHGITVTEMSMSYWKDRYLGAKRIVQY